MTRISSFLCVSSSCTLFLLAVWGCGKRQVHPEVPGGGHYEIAWVEPQVLVSDSLYTLIRAERIDSFYVGQPSDFSSTEAPSVMFHVTDDECFTSVNLLNSTGEVIKPLLVKNLPSGFYKLTFHLSGLSEGNFYLRVDYCDSSVIQPFRFPLVK